MSGINVKKYAEIAKEVFGEDIQVLEYYPISGPMGQFEIPFYYFPRELKFVLDADRGRFSIRIYDETGDWTSLDRIRRHEYTTNYHCVRESFIILKEVFEQEEFCFYKSENEHLYRKENGEYRRIKNRDEEISRNKKLVQEKERLRRLKQQKEEKQLQEGSKKQPEIIKQDTGHKASADSRKKEVISLIFALCFLVIVALPVFLPKIGFWGICSEVLITFTLIVAGIYSLYKVLQKRQEKKFYLVSGILISLFILGLGINNLKNVVVDLKNGPITTEISDILIEENISIRGILSDSYYLVLGRGKYRFPISISDKNTLLKRREVTVSYYPKMKRIVSFR